MTEVRMIHSCGTVDTQIEACTHFNATPMQLAGPYTSLDLPGVFTPKNGTLELSYVESTE